MAERLNVLKTYKLFVDGKFPRSESGRSMSVSGANGEILAHVSQASRKDLRDAIEAARKAQPGWAGATAYNRGQILYRMAEMLEGKRNELQEAIASVGVVGAGRGTAGKAAKGGGKGRGAAKLTTISAKEAAAEVAASIDRLVAFAGWADKYAHVLGCQNPVSGPYYNFTVPEPTGVVGVIAPDSPSLLALIGLVAPVVCSGNTVVALASTANPLPGAVLGEVFATSDVPAGVINVLTGDRSELLGQFSTHRDLDAIHAGVSSVAEATTLREGMAENLKRVVIRDGDVDWRDHEGCTGPDWIEAFVEMKTIWHPAAV